MQGNEEAQQHLLPCFCPASTQLLPAVEALLVAVLEILSLADDDDAPLRAMSKYLLPAVMTAFGKLGGSKAVDKETVLCCSTI